MNVKILEKISFNVCNLADLADKHNERYQHILIMSDIL